jgi:hypothetical protein
MPGTSRALESGIDDELRYLVAMNFALRQQISENLKRIRTLLQEYGCGAAEREIDSLLADMARDMQPQEIAGITIDDVIAGLSGGD